MQPFPLGGVKRWEGRQRRIGLTGGIASGKSSVGRYLLNKGLPVLDADIYAREALAPGSQASNTVLQRYGTTIAEPQAVGESTESQQRRINRSALSKIVFSDYLERQWLEQLIHPLVKARLEQELDQLQKEDIVVLMIPLLFEANITKVCSEIWVVRCTPEQQLLRLQRRNKLDQATAEAQINAQWPLSKKCKLSDVLIDNDGGQECWKEQVEIALAKEHKINTQTTLKPT